MRGQKKGAAQKNKKPAPKTAEKKRVQLIRPPQPIPLPKWKVIDDPARYDYLWSVSSSRQGRHKGNIAERLAVTEDPAADPHYSYIHLSDCNDGKLDHWVLTSKLTQRSGQEQTKHKQFVRWIDHIIFGDLNIPVWYPSSFPSSLHPKLLANGGRLYVCEVCLKYTTDPNDFARHKSDRGNCGGEGPLRGLLHPPGCETYSSFNWSVWDVDGGDSEATLNDDELLMWERSSVLSYAPKEGSITQMEAQSRSRYCHALSLISRLFLENKLNRYGTSPFRFYVLTEMGRNQHGEAKHMLRGMFSKEKGHSINNLSCIVMLPPWQRSGWGKRLIHISYLLSRIENTSGVPEKPLSTLGKRVYSTYQKGQILDYLSINCDQLHRDTGKLIADIEHATSIDREDVIEALKELSSDNGSAANEIDWVKVLSPNFSLNAERPELQLNQSELFHISHHTGQSQPTVEI